MANKLAFARGAAQLVGDGFIGTVDVVEGVHQAVVQRLPARRPIASASAFVYSSVRGIGRMVVSALAGSIGLLEKFRADAAPIATNDRQTLAWLSAINGIYGDHLELSGNPLALAMSFRRAGAALPTTQAELANALPDARENLIVLVHGLGMNDLQWRDDDSIDLGAFLEPQLDATAIHLRYNSGRHISSNGRVLASQLQTLIEHWPVRVQRLTLIGHSMGGLVCRSACHYAEKQSQSWLQRLSDLVCLASPHLGAPLERFGHQTIRVLGMSEFTRAFVPIGAARSVGIKDLRHAWLRDEDWKVGDDELPSSPQQPPVLPAHVRVFLVAATLARKPSGSFDVWRGDGLVPVASALGQHADPSRSLPVPAQNRHVFTGLGHVAILSNPQVRAKLLAWLGSTPPRLEH
jgi:pimeloyl-ACP methyl ester carboxylesterase